MRMKISNLLVKVKRLKRRKEMNGSQNETVEKNKKEHTPVSGLSVMKVENPLTASAGRI